MDDNGPGHVRPAEAAEFIAGFERRYPQALGDAHDAYYRRAGRFWPVVTLTALAFFVVALAILGWEYRGVKDVGFSFLSLGFGVYVGYRLLIVVAFDLFVVRIKSRGIEGTELDELCQAAELAGYDGFEGRAPFLGERLIRSPYKITRVRKRRGW